VCGVGFKWLVIVYGFVGWVLCGGLNGEAEVGRLWFG